MGCTTTVIRGMPGVWNFNRLLSGVEAKSFTRKILGGWGISKLTSETHPSGHMTVIYLKPFDLQSWASPLQSKTSCLLEVSRRERERENGE